MSSSSLRFAAVPLILGSLSACSSAQAPKPPLQVTPPMAGTLSLPEVGQELATVLTPTLLELEVVTLKQPDPAPAPGPNFIGQPPTPADFEVLANGQKVAVSRAGYKRRPVYAPLKTRDLRVGNWVYLELANPLPEGANLEIRDAGRQFLPQNLALKNGVDAKRVSPLLHINEAGYLPSLSKLAFVGYYLGSLGEVNLPAGTPFQIIDAAGKTAFSGTLHSRPDSGWKAKPYQAVLEADFSALTAPGTYRLSVPGLGVSRPFAVGTETGGLLARTYALGLYNQRCGAPVELPYSRHTHAACHTEMAEIPTMEFESTNRSIKGMSEGAEKDPLHTAPRMVDIKSSLYPFVKQGKIDVSGGHHDAGDYSVYTINSAQLVSVLTFSADAFPGAGDLDNLGIPESGDGKSDLLQEAKWEADYLLKMQDDDGGFFFLKYPRNRKYEDNVLPDKGDPQVVFPKNTAATGAATAALAQMASSPRFQKQFPEAAARYRQAAQRGWQFLQAAIAKYGRDGSYQRISHYGDIFRHDDELAWAAVEMFLLTGDKDIAAKWLADFDPSSPETRHWSWERMFQSYGCANRSYAFAVQTGRAKEADMEPRLLKLTRDEVVAAAQDQADRARQNAYGTSFPIETKRFNAAGWYFSSTQAFDLAVGYALEPKPEFMTALLTNFGFEWGANPQNVPFVTGVGDIRQHDIVHQYAQNDRRALPPSGIPIGSVWGGFMYLDKYKKELGLLTFPSDGDANAPYAPMDRWADTFNVSTEFVVSNQAAALGAASFLMAQGPLKNQAWNPAKAAPQIVKAGGRYSLKVAGLNPAASEIVWEEDGAEPRIAPELSNPAGTSPSWVEAEALWPDGRRVAASLEAKP